MGGCARACRFLADFQSTKLFCHYLRCFYVAAFERLNPGGRHALEKELKRSKLETESTSTPLLISAFPSDILQNFKSWHLRRLFLSAEKLYGFYQTVEMYFLFIFALVCLQFHFTTFWYSLSKITFIQISPSTQENSQIYTHCSFSLRFTCKFSWDYSLSCELYLVKKIAAFR